MKNLLIYISPTGSFNNPRSDLTSNDAGPLAKVQIENSLALGWKKEDILLVTNFEFQYGDFKATVLKDAEFFDRKPQGSKINAILKLFEAGIIKGEQLYWFHDMDAFQLEPITEEEIDISTGELALTDYGGNIKFGGEDRWSTGIIFFKSGSKDIFEKIKEVMYQKSIDEEEALGLLVIEDQKIRKRIKKVSSSYNFIGYNLKPCYKKAIKPLKVVHFHPLAGNRRLKTDSSLRFFMGENYLNLPLITERLLKLFKFHRIRDVKPIDKKRTVGVIIPTFKRAHKIPLVYKRTKDSSPIINEVYFIVEGDDQGSIDVLESNQIPYFINERSRKPAGALNTAFNKTTEQYLFTGADDFDYKPGWLEKCLEMMVDPVKVVGTNDLHNRDVLKGIYATSFLIDRDYINEQSGTFDEPGLILTETYLHNFPDREFAEIAQLRGVYAHCFEAIVEHLHWSYGLSEKDETYDKQRGTQKRDHRLYLERKALWTEKIRHEQNR